MIWLIDTCFWLHMQEIYTYLKIDLRVSLEQIRWGYTPQLLTEFRNYNLDNFIPLKNGYLIPVSDEELTHFQDQHPFMDNYDIADQSLMLSALRDNSLILTDDGGLLMELEEIRLKGFFLPTFCLILVKKGDFTKNTCAKLLKFWETMGSYTAKFLKRCRIELQKIV